jgi:hypothetical protein
MATVVPAGNNEGAGVAALPRDSSDGSLVGHSGEPIRMVSIACPKGLTTVREITLVQPLA